MSDGVMAMAGSGGKTGRAVTAALLRLGVPETRIRRLVRPGRERRGDRAADLTDAGSMTAALEGADVLHLVVPNLHPDEPGIARTAVDAARAAGVRRIVYHSVLRPGVREMPHHWGKLEAEEILWAAGLEVTVLQPSAYAQNLLACVQHGEIVVPYAVDVPFSLVDLADVAEVTATVLAEPGVHDGATYELAGPVVTVQELAARSGLLARRAPSAPSGPARTDGPPETSRPDPTGGDYAARALRGMFAWYDRHGLAGNPRVLTWLLGRPPRAPHVVLAEGTDRPVAAG